MLLHIHGFNSSPASNTFHMLRAAFPGAQALAYACHGLFADNLTALREQAVTLYATALRGRGGQGSGQPGRDAASTSSMPTLPLVISGSSLGGFYASQLAALLRHELAAPCHCALFNPVVYPALALRPFLGRNTLLHSGEAWEFTPVMLESYAHFTDTRKDSRKDAGTRWDKETGGEAGTGKDSKAHGLPDLRRFVLLGRNDSLLNPEEARAYWQGHAQIHDTDDEHSIAALDAVTVAALRELGAGA